MNNLNKFFVDIDAKKLSSTDLLSDLVRAAVKLGFDAGRTNDGIELDRSDPNRSVVLFKYEDADDFLAGEVSKMDSVDNDVFRDNHKYNVKMALDSIDQCRGIVTRFKAPPSREVSLVITKLQEAYFWLQEYERRQFEVSK